MVTQTRGASLVEHPTSVYSLFGDKVRVLVFGRNTNFAKPGENPHAQSIVAGWVKQFGVSDVYMPDVTNFNAEIVDPDHDPDHVKFPTQLAVGKIKFHADYKADGVVLNKPSAFLVASADCPTFIVRFADGRVVATHAGRDCLVDRSAINGGTPRANESVVFAALRQGEVSPEMKSALLCGIGPKHFTHPCTSTGQHDNRALISYIRQKWGDQCVESPDEYGRIDLHKLVKYQLASAGASTEPAHFSHDGVDTYSHGTASGGKPFYHSHRRDGDRGGRNGVLVIRME